MAAKRKKPEPTASDYLGALKNMFVVDPRNSPGATMGQAVYDYLSNATPQSVVQDIRNTAQDAKKWAARESRELRKAPIGRSLQLMKSGYVDPLLEPFRVFQQSAEARAGGNDEASKRLAAAVPLAVFSAVNPELRGAGKLATKAAAGKATRAAATPKLPKAAPNPLHEVALEFGPAIARRLDGLIDPSAPLSEWRKAATRLASADAPNVSTKAPSPYTVRPADVATDPRIESRKGELGKISNLELEISPRITDPAPEVSIFDFEGHPYITSMSDLAAAGDDIISINGVRFRVPFSRRGGQDYMFDNPGSVWASERKPAERHVELAQRLQDLTGKDVLYMPWTMGPNAVQFSHMPRGVQYRYGEAAIGGGDRRSLEQEIRQILPEWRSFEDPDSAQMFMTATGKARGALNDLFDRYRTRGGLGRGEATYASTDLTQIGAPLTTLKNVGIIDPRFGASPSSHASYNYSIPGRGLGVLREKNIGALALSPDVMAELGYRTPFDFPVGVQPGTKSPLRAMQMKPQGGVLDYETLRFLEKLLKDSE